MSDIPETQCHCCSGTGREIDARAVGPSMARLRKEAGIKQGDMAKRMFISQPYLCDLEHGNRAWTENMITQYKEALKA